MNVLAFGTIDLFGFVFYGENAGRTRQKSFCWLSNKTQLPSKINRYLGAFFPGTIIVKIAKCSKVFDLRKNNGKEMKIGAEQKKKVGNMVKSRRQSSKSLESPMLGEKTQS